MLILEGELLDGFHVEHVPQYHTTGLDTDALSFLSGMRAVWLLYLSGSWDHLEDLGVDREEVEPVLKQFQFGSRLTVRQARQLQQKVPALVEASKELRIAYALKHMTSGHKEKRMSVLKPEGDMFIYHAEVNTATEAKEAVTAHKAEVEAAGGTIEVGYGRGEGAIIMVKLPKSQNVEPQNLLSHSSLKFSKVRAQTIAVPQKEA